MELALNADSMGDNYLPSRSNLTSQKSTEMIRSFQYSFIASDVSHRAVSIEVSIRSAQRTAFSLPQGIEDLSTRNPRN